MPTPSQLLDALAELKSASSTDSVSFAKKMSSFLELITSKSHPEGFVPLSTLQTIDSNVHPVKESVDAAKEVIDLQLQENAKVKAIELLLEGLESNAKTAYPDLLSFTVQQSYSNLFDFPLFSVCVDYESYSKLNVILALTRFEICP
ncbi:hypothetical protein GEMRC1_007773 [Eukaryota sp. GEM-RC1]